VIEPVTALLAVSMIETVDPPLFVTYTRPPAVATPNGWAPTGMVRRTERAAAGRAN